MGTLFPLLAIFIFSFETAQAAKECEEGFIRLAPDLTPIVPINFRGSTQTAWDPYKTAARQVSWEALVGREVIVEFRNPDGTHQVRQTVTSVERLRREDPRFAAAVADLLVGFDQHKAKIVAQLPPKILSSLDEDMKDYLAGEGMTFLFACRGTKFNFPAQFRTAHITSDIRGQPKSEVSLKLDIDNMIKTLARGRWSFQRFPAGEKVEIIWIHTHPGEGVPINHQDEQASGRFLLRLREHFPHLMFRLRFVAAPTQNRGTIVYLQDSETR